MAYTPPSQALWENTTGQRDDALARIAAADKAQADALATKDAAHAAEIAKRDATIATHLQTIKDTQALVDALGGTPLALKMARQKRIDELTVLKAAADAELAKLK